MDRVEVYPTKTAWFTEKLSARPTPIKTPADKTASPSFSPVDSKLLFPATAETPVLDYATDFATEDSDAESTDLHEAVEALMNRLEQNVAPSSTGKPSTSITAASKPITKTKSSIFLSIAVAKSGSRIEPARLFNNFLPLVAVPEQATSEQITSEQITSGQAQAATSNNVPATAPPIAIPSADTLEAPNPFQPLPQPLPTPDSMIRTARVPILMYHYLSTPPADADIYRQDLSVTPNLFARHLDSMLEAGYQTINLYDLTMHLTIGAPLPAKPVIITFDDGYRDNYDNAFPLLVERGMEATFFISPEFIDRKRPEYADWQMLRSMHRGGMSIEAHGLNHRTLKKQDVEFLAWQALASIQAIEREIGQRPRFVSYPAGEYDPLTIEVFHNSHFWAGLTTVQGMTHQADALFEMQRIRVRNTSQPEKLIELMNLDW